jgi:hypothetical protein
MGVWCALCRLPCKATCASQRTACAVAAWVAFQLCAARLREDACTLTEGNHAVQAHSSTDASTTAEALAVYKQPLCSSMLQQGMEQQQQAQQPRSRSCSNAGSIQHATSAATARARAVRAHVAVVVPQVHAEVPDVARPWLDRGGMRRERVQGGTEHGDGAEGHIYIGRQGCANRD